MAFREIGARLTLEGASEWNNQMKASDRELANLKSELVANTAAFNGNANSAEALRSKQELLQRQHDQQAEKVRALRQALEFAEGAYGDTSKEADNYRQKLNYAEAAVSKLDTALQENAGYLEEAEKSTDGLASSIDGYGKKVKEAGDESAGLLQQLNALVPGLDLTALKGKLTGAALAAAFKQAWSYAMGLVESTKELRTSLDKLESAAGYAGMTMDDKLISSLRTCYELTGDMDSSFEAVSNLIAADYGDSQLTGILDYLSAAVINFPDTLKIESLADSLQETLATGSATGQFSEALERLGVDVDGLNTSLAACADQSWRQSIVFETLAETSLDEVAAAYRAANADEIALADANFDLEMANARLAESFVPVAAKMTETKAKFSNWLGSWITGQTHSFALDDLISIRDQGGFDSINAVADAIESLDMSFDTLKIRANAAGMSMGEYLNQAAAAAEETEAAAGASVNYAYMLETQKTAVEGALEKLEQLQATYDGLRANVDGVISGFVDMDAAMESNATTADDMVAALQSQLDYLAEYEENLKWAADMGLSDALIQELSDGSAQSAAYLAAIVEDGGQSIDKLNAKFAAVEEGKQEFVDSVAALLPGFQETLDDVTAALDEAVDNWNMYGDSYIAGSNTMAGLENSMSARMGALYALGQEAYNSFQRGYAAAADQHSPSRAAERLFNYTADGFIIAGQRRLIDMENMGRKMGGAVLSGYAGSAGNVNAAAAGTTPAMGAVSAGTQNAAKEITFMLTDGAGRVIARASESDMDNLSGTGAKLKARGVAT